MTVFQLVRLGLTVDRLVARTSYDFTGVANAKTNLALYLIPLRRLDALREEHKRKARGVGGISRHFYRVCHWERARVWSSWLAGARYVRNTNTLRRIELKPRDIDGFTVLISNVDSQRAPCRPGCDHLRGHFNVWRDVANGCLSLPFRMNSGSPRVEGGQCGNHKGRERDPVAWLHCRPPSPPLKISKSDARGESL